MDYYKSKNNSINILFRKTDIKHKKKQSKNFKSSTFLERKIVIKGVGQHIFEFFLIKTLASSNIKCIFILYKNFR